MRIATWNVNGLRARLDFVLQWLRDRQPDVVGLQELKLTDEQFPHDALASVGYRAAVYGQKAWNGVAILSRATAEVTQRGLPGQDDFGSRLITANVSGISYTTVYCPNGKNLEHQDFPHKLAWFESLREHLARTHAPGEPIVVGGDFNICPAPIDSWRETASKVPLGDRIFHTDAERRQLRDLLGWGLTDTFRHLHPDTQEFSWWDYRGGAFHRKQGLRIDFLLASQPALQRLQSVEIDRDYRKKKDGLTPSDHAPVIAVLD